MSRPLEYGRVRSEMQLVGHTTLDAVARPQTFEGADRDRFTVGKSLGTHDRRRDRNNKAHQGPNSMHRRDRSTRGRPDHCRQGRQDQNT